MDIAVAVSVVAVAALAAFVILRLYSIRQAAESLRVMETTSASSRTAGDAEVLPVLRQANLDDFNVADYSDDRAVLVNELLMESQRVSRKLEHVSGALREDVSTITGLSDKIVRLQAEIQSRDEQLRDLEIRLGEQRNETIRVLEEKNQVTDRAENMEMELSRRTNTLDATKEALISMENSYRELLGQNNGLKADIAHLQEDLQQSQARTADLNTTLEQRDGEMHRLNMELAEVRSDVTSERNRANLAEAKVTRLLKQLDEVRADSENDVDRFRSERDLLKVKLDQAQDGLEGLRQRLVESERNRDRAVNQVELLRNELASLRAETSTKAATLESSNRELSSHITVLERILEQYRMKPVTGGAPADASRLRVVSREGEAG